MEIGVVLPLGVDHEYAAFEPQAAWVRCQEMAHRAEALGFGSLALYDHILTDHGVEDEITFESFAVLAALVPLTTRIRLGHLVLAAGFRNPALTTKAICTLDALSGGRIWLGLGAGWKRDEWIAYGYGFPPLVERQDILRDALEVATRLMAPGRATFEGRHASVHAAVNVPKPTTQPRTPIVVGGNGPTVTWRLAARFADELNLDEPSPAAVAAALPVIAGRCREIGRDPASLLVSAHVTRRVAGQAGPERTARLREYRDIGLSRVVAQVPGWVSDDGELEALADDARSAGIELESRSGS